MGRIVSEEGFEVDCRQRMAGIDANLDDLQSGMEASSRAAEKLHTDTTKFDGLLKGSLLRSVLRHVEELRACARDQRVALQELRNSLATLRNELQFAKRSAIRPPPVAGAELPRR
jgi:hypothetical protein